MIAKPYSLKFVNNGEAFAIPNWTTEKHEASLSKLAEGTKGMPEEKKDGEFKHYVIHETLSAIDETGDCTLDTIRNMHPVDLIELFKAVYNAGREGIYSADFLKGEKTPSKKRSKSIGKKSIKNSKN